MRSMGIALFLIAGASTAVALTVTSGTADLIPSGFMSPSGRESFSLAGAAFSFRGSGTNSAAACSIVPCPPGSQIPYTFTELSSEDRGITGNITVGSDSFDYSLGPGSPLGDADLRFSFSLSTPGVNPPSSVTLSAPFTATALFDDRRFESGQFFLFNGAGTITADLTLAPFGDRQAYFLDSMHFDFGAVPEPSTGAMVIGGIAVAGICRRRQQKNGATSLYGCRVE